MSKMKSGCGGQIPQPLNSKITNILQRQYLGTAADRISIPHCGHPNPTVRNVTAPLGEASYLCRECYGYLRRVEVKAVVWRDVAAQLRNWSPLGEIRGAFLPAGEGVAICN